MELEVNLKTKQVLELHLNVTEFCNFFSFLFLFNSFCSTILLFDSITEWACIVFIL